MINTQITAPNKAGRKKNSFQAGPKGPNKTRPRMDPTNPTNTFPMMPPGMCLCVINPAIAPMPPPNKSVMIICMRTVSSFRLKWTYRMTCEISSYHQTYR